jgi:hypothetical protein
MFRPLRAIFRWYIQLDVFKDYFYYVHNLTYAYISTSTRGPHVVSKKEK